MLKPIRSIHYHFHQEFGCLKDKFNIILLSIKEARESDDPEVTMPGVYIYWKDDNILKVGRHLVNSRKRALEHIRDNTGEEVGIPMKSIDTCKENCGIVLINCENEEEYHWVAAIEIYMERVLKPMIRSQRTG